MWANQSYYSKHDFFQNDKRNKKASNIERKGDKHSPSMCCYNLRGSMFLGNSFNSNMPWNILKNKLVLIGRFQT